MRYAMKQKLFSWGDDFAIQDDSGHDVFFVDGKAFSFGDQLSFQDMDRNELCFIKQKVLSWGPTYELYEGRKKFASIKKSFTFFKTEFTVDIPGPNDYTVTGDFLSFEYKFKRRNRTVARVSKKFFSWTDSYGVDIKDGEDDILILATTVVIDMVCHSGDDH